MSSSISLHVYTCICMYIRLCQLGAAVYSITPEIIWMIIISIHPFAQYGVRACICVTCNTSPRVGVFTIPIATSGVPIEVRVTGRMKYSVINCPELSELVPLQVLNLT